jgi:carbon monoxide dehydrogenase subunit G
MSGEYRIPAPKNQVWRALNDPAVLQQAIPGCRDLERISDTELTATVVAKVGPVKATFSGRVTLSDLDPPHGYTISGEGQGGAAGFGKGSAKVSLAEEAGETVLRYTADVQVGGKLAQIGQRLVGSAAKKSANDFFSAFAAAVAAESPPPEAPPAAAAIPDEPPTAPLAGQQRGVRSLVWTAGLIIVVVALWIFYASQGSP